jgi:hypothetical protein
MQQEQRMPASRQLPFRALLAALLALVLAACGLWAALRPPLPQAHADDVPISSRTWEEAKPIIESVLGVPYVWGGKSTSGWDCSGFVGWVLQNAYGIAGQQGASTGSLKAAFSGNAIYTGWSASDYNAAFDTGIIKPGDLVIFFNASGIDVHCALSGEAFQVYHAWYDPWGTGLCRFDYMWGIDGGHGKTFRSFTVYRGLTDPPKWGAIDILKRSSAEAFTNNNGCYSLAGASYGVFTEDGAQVAQIDLAPYDYYGNDAGYGTTEMVFPAGNTYLVRETKAPAGYALDPNTYTVVIDGGETVRVNTHYVWDDPLNAPLAALVKKVDAEGGFARGDVAEGGVAEGGVADAEGGVAAGAEGGVAAGADVSSEAGYGPLGLNLPQGGASLVGAEYTIRFFPAHFATVADAEASGAPERTWVFATDEDGMICLGDSSGGTGTFISGDDLYRNSQGEPTLPLGSVLVHETKAPEGYLLPDPSPVYLGRVVASNGACAIEWDDGILFPQNKNAIISWEQVIRGDFEFLKVAGPSTGQPIAQVPFKVSSKTTGESHVLVTDARGSAHTSANIHLHTRDTNYNDAFLVDPSFPLDPKAGIWFGEGDPQDSLGALPYDTYVIEELPCKANATYELLEPFEVVIKENAVSVDLEVLADGFVPRISTIARSGAGYKLVPATQRAIIRDNVSYSGLSYDTRYILTGTLMDKSSGKPLLRDGQEVIAASSFTAMASTGTIDVVFSFDATGLEGVEVVVFEKLWLCEEDGSSVLAVSHEDINDLGQTVLFETPPVSPPMPAPKSSLPKTEDDKGSLACFFGLTGAVGLCGIIASRFAARRRPRERARQTAGLFPEGLDCGSAQGSYDRGIPATHTGSQHERGSMGNTPQEHIPVQAGSHPKGRIKAPKLHPQPFWMDKPFRISSRRYRAYPNNPR